MELDFSAQIKELTAKKQNFGGKADTSEPEKKAKAMDDESEAAKAAKEKEMCADKKACAAKEDPSDEEKGETKEVEKKEDESGEVKSKMKSKVKASLEKSLKAHNEKFDRQVTLQQLEAAFDRGAKTYDSTHRPGKSRAQWAFARVNAFLKLMAGVKVSEEYAAADQDIVNQVFASTGGEFFSYQDIEFDLAKLSVVQAGIKDSELNLVVEF
jgi:hypothetical protein